MFAIHHACNFWLLSASTDIIAIGVHFKPIFTKQVTHHGRRLIIAFTEVVAICIHFVTKFTIKCTGHHWLFKALTQPFTIGSVFIAMFTMHPATR
jgi:hypothetical protein